MPPKPAARHSTAVQEKTPKPKAKGTKRAPAPDTKTGSKKRKAQGGESEGEFAPPSAKGSTVRKGQGQGATKAKLAETENEEEGDEDEELLDEGRSNADEDEEEEEEEEEVETHGSQGGLGNIVKDLSKQFQTKKAKTAAKKDDENKQVVKFDEHYRAAVDEMDELASGERGLDARRQKVDDYLSNLESLSVQSEEKVERLESLVKSRATDFLKLRPSYESHIRDYKAPVVTVLHEAVAEYEKRPKLIQDMIKIFTKAQRDKLKQVDERNRIKLDAKAMIRHSRKMMRASIKASQGTMKP